MHTNNTFYTIPLLHLPSNCLAIFVLALVGCIPAQDATAQTTQQYYVVANGGQPMSTATYSLQSTVGQSLAGYTSTPGIIHGSGFWYTERAEMLFEPVHVEDGRLPENQPHAFSLLQNYPNPFNPQTSISYTLSDSGPVTLTVFDLLGREVRRLVDAYKSTGTHEVTFNATDLPSGMYMYVLTSESASITRQMILLK